MLSLPIGETMTVSDVAVGDTLISEPVGEAVLLPDSEVTTETMILAILISKLGMGAEVV
jgi:hypothetical protein